MNQTQHTDSIESQLAAESAWSPRDGAKAPELWKSALGGRTRTIAHRRRLTATFWSVAAVLLIGTLAVSISLPAVSRARIAQRTAATLEEVDKAYDSFSHDRSGGAVYAGVPASSRSLGQYGSFIGAPLPTEGAPITGESAVGFDGRQSSTNHGFIKQGLANAQYLTITDGVRTSDLSPPASSTSDAPLRQVIRKSQLSLAVDDVRAAFLHINEMVLSEAGGEYIQDSSLTGQDTDKKNQTATLTLRVAVARLGAVLTKLRDLGSVAAESSGGEDVTDQIIDIEARLRNEQRIETELLSLLETRRGSPLSEILSLRQSIDASRERIERLMAQRDRLSRLVALATVTVIIRHKDAGQIAAAQPVADPTFIDKLGASFQRGGDSLLRSVAWLIEVIIGGLLGWLFLAFLAVAALDIRRRLLRRAAVEPPPAA